MADNQKKDGFFKKAASNAKATKSEFKKVSWPTKKQLINNTGIVIVCIVVVGVVIFALDTIFGLGLTFITNKKVDNVQNEIVESMTGSDIFEDIELSTAEAFTEAETVQE